MLSNSHLTRTVSNRLAALKKKNGNSRRQDAFHLSTPARSLSLSGQDDRQKLLDKMAEQLGMTRSNLEELFGEKVFGEKLFGKQLSLKK